MKRLSPAACAFALVALTCTHPASAEDSEAVVSFATEDGGAKSDASMAAARELDAEAWLAAAEELGDPEVDDEPPMPAASSQLGERASAAKKKDVPTKVSFTIVRLSKVPQYKTEMKMKSACAVVCVKTKFPSLSKRYATKELRAVVKFSNPAELKPADFKKMVDQCGKRAAVAAVGAAVAAPPSAVPIFKSSFYSCMSDKVGDKANLIRASVGTASKTTSWKEI